MELPDDVLEVLLHRAHTGQYVNSVAHDLNNLIGATMAYAELIEMDSTDPVVKRMVGEIVSAVEKSSELLNAIAAIARPLHIDPDGRCDVANLFEAVTLLFTYDCKLAQIEFSTSAPEDLGELAVDEHLVQRVLMRLVDNAMESVKGRDTSAVTLSAARKGDEVQISVRDSGPGVPEGDAARIFEAGFTTKEGHLGMGLTTTRQLAELGGMQLEYATEQGFTLTARASEN